MTEDSPIVQFEKDIEGRIDYFSNEYDLTVSETIGSLEIIKQKLLLRLLLPKREEH